METVNQPLVEGTTTENGATEKVESSNVPKTYSQSEVDGMLKNRFTQEQVNAIIEKRLNREKTKNPETVSQNSVQKPVEDKSKFYQSELVKAQIKMVEYEKQIALSKYQIDDKYKNYIDYVATRNTNKDKTYNQALDEFMAGEGLQYLKQQVGTTPRPENVGTQMNETQAYIFKKYGKRI